MRSVRMRATFSSPVYGGSTREAGDGGWLHQRTTPSVSFADTSPAGGGGGKTTTLTAQKLARQNRRAPFMIPRKKTWWITIHPLFRRPYTARSPGMRGGERCRNSLVRIAVCGRRFAFAIQTRVSRGRRADEAFRPGRLLQPSLRGKAGPPLPLNLGNRRRTRSVGGAVKTARGA